MLFADKCCKQCEKCSSEKWDRYEHSLYPQKGAVLMRKSPLLRVASAAAIASLSLGLVACSKDKTTDTTVAAAAAETTAAMAAETGAAETTAAMAAETTAAMAAETSAAAAADAGAPKDIIDTAVAAGSFNTLAKLLTDAGLVETLKGAGPFTVFAPTDEAFAKVPADTLAKLAADKAMLTKVLTHHVVAGKVMAADIKPGDVATVAGPNVTLSVADGKVMVNGATVTTADVAASNGVIHIIDQVILPPA
jgi:uncharacterized surface protein with fasciclin (FAS1) repeats